MREDIGKPAVFWNERSPLVWRIVSLYERSGAIQADNNRIASLCRRLGITVWELGAQMGMLRLAPGSKLGAVRVVLDKGGISTCWRRNRWPMWMGVQLQGLESYLDRKASAKDAAMAILISNRG